jgi:hypothetical protein
VERTVPLTRSDVPPVLAWIVFVSGRMIVGAAGAVTASCCCERARVEAQGVRSRSVSRPSPDRRLRADHPAQAASRTHA